MHEAGLIGPLKRFEELLNWLRLKEIWMHLLDVMVVNRNITLEDETKDDIIKYTLYELMNGEDSPFYYMIQSLRRVPKCGFANGMTIDACMNVLYTYTFAYRTSVILNRIYYSQYAWWMELTFEDVGKHCIQQYCNAVNLMKQYFNTKYISKENDEHSYDFKKTLRENEIMEKIHESDSVKLFSEEPKELKEIWKGLFGYMIYSYDLLNIEETFAIKVFEYITEWLHYNLDRQLLTWEEINYSLKDTPFSSMKKSFQINGIFTAWFATIVDQICYRIKYVTNDWKYDITEEDIKLFDIEKIKVFDIVDIYEMFSNEEYTSRNNAIEKFQGLKHDCVVIKDETVCTAKVVTSEVRDAIVGFASNTGEIITDGAKNIANRIKKIRNND